MESLKQHELRPFDYVGRRRPKEN